MSDKENETKGAASPGKHALVIANIVKYFAASGIAFDAVGNTRDAATWLVKREPIPDHARRFAYVERSTHHVDTSYVIETMEVIAMRARDARRAALISQVIRQKTTGEGNANLRRWLKAVTGREDDTDYAVVRHWLWLVKRGLAEMPITHHIMPILSGPQGGGKSTALRMLFGPLEELALMPCNASILTDDKRAPLLADHAVAVLDEMEGVGKADASALKQTITADTKTYRPMRTNAAVTVPVRCRFIGATNEPVAGLVNDVTGARRFYDLACAERFDWSIINAIDYLSLWSCVSEDEAAPIVSHGETVAARQAGLRREDSVSLWTASEAWTITPEMRPSFEAPGNWLSTAAMRGLYAAWCGKHSQQVMDIVSWGRRLASLGFERSKRGPFMAQVPGYLVPNIREIKTREKTF